MADWSWVFNLKDVISFAADSKAILGGVGGLTLISAAGAMPKVGFLRALMLGGKSYFKTSTPLSVRRSEIQQLNASILSMQRGSYITVVGGKGNGKTCLIDTALNRHCGVVKFSTKSGADKDIIIDQALRAITGIQLDLIKPTSSARRLLFFYSFMFTSPPIVVIRVPERQMGQQYADVTSAVRALADDFGLSVIVDGSPNSIPPELLTTKRQTVIAVEPMSKEQIESIPEFERLIDVLKSRHLDIPVWKVLGGSPADYLKLEEALDKNSLMSKTASDEVVDQVKNYLQIILSHALNKNIFNSSLTTQQIIKIFCDKKIIKIPKSELKAMGLLLDYPNKVFREVSTLEGYYIETSSPAIALLISENIHDDVGVRELREKLFKVT